MSNRVVNILVPVISVILGLLVGAIVMLVSGYDPIARVYCTYGMVFLEMLMQLVRQFVQITPYLLAGLSVHLLSVRDYLILGLKVNY